MIDLKINKELLEILKQEGFYSDTMLIQYLILHCYYNDDMDAVELLDDSSKAKRLLIQQYELVRREFLIESDDRKGFIITSKGKSFFKKIDDFLNPKKEVKSEDVSDWIDQWLELFPKGVKTGGKLLRSDKKICSIKMSKFMREYPYDKNTILNATKAYLNEREQDNWAYTKCAVYFIDKRGEGSELAGWCENDKHEEPTFESSNTNLI